MRTVPAVVLGLTSAGFPIRKYEYCFAANAGCVQAIRIAVATRMRIGPPFVRGSYPRPSALHEMIEERLQRRTEPNRIRNRLLQSPHVEREACNGFSTAGAQIAGGACRHFATAV